MSPNFYFGPFELRTRSRELFKHGVKLKLRPQPYQVLEVLLDQAGQTVTRDDLRKRLWPSDTFVDFEHGLNTAIKEVRAALADSAADPHYIETLPKLGYRVITPVTTSPAPLQPVTQSPVEPTATAATIPIPPSPPNVPQEQPRRIHPTLAIAIACLILLALVGLLRLRANRDQQARASNPSPVMVAVLPFENLTGDSTQDYFADGLTEEMIAQLGKLSPDRLGVIARTSVIHYKNSPPSVDQIGRELGVQYLLTGSVRRDPQKVRITAQLVKVPGGQYLWSQVYDRGLTNLLTVQAEIAREIADAIQLTIGGEKIKTPAPTATLTTASYGAYDLYLKGLFFWNKRTTSGFTQAIACFQQAIAKDPNYAPAYAGLANSYTLLSAYTLAPAAKYMPSAREAALHALQIDERLPEAHVALALVVQNYDWDWNTSGREFRRAIELNPNYVTAHHWYAEHLAWRGRFDEALKESDVARKLDPLSLIISTDRGAILYYSRQYDRAIDQFRAVLDMDPHFSHAHLLADAYAQKGLHFEALADVRTWQSNSGEGDTPWIYAKRAHIYALAGQPAKARQEILQMKKAVENREIDPALFIEAEIAIANTDQIFARLEKAYAQHSDILTTLKVDPAYDPLRQDPRFQNLLRRLDLQP